MKVIVSKDMLQHEEDLDKKIKIFLKYKTILENWSVNISNNIYVFEYIHSNNINLFGEVNDDYLEMIIKD